MARQQSLKHEYEVYVERAIEEFKDSVPRSHLLSLGDEAVAALNAEAQTTLTEMVLWEEVDRIIARRLQLPTYATWRRRRLRRLAELRRPERWGLAPDGVLACALRDAAGEHVLFASADADEATLFSAALGCNVTALTLEPSALDRMFAEADEVGIGAQVRGCVCALGGWSPTCRSAPWCARATPSMPWPKPSAPWWSTSCSGPPPWGACTCCVDARTGRRP
jgi:hypothetical protein